MRAGFRKPQETSPPSGRPPSLEMAASNSARKPGFFAFTRFAPEGFQEQYVAFVKKLLAVFFALISGVYVIFGPFPDPLPFLDEATALLIFVKSMAVLGVDLSRFVPFLGKKAKTPPKPPGPVVDV